MQPFRKALACFSQSWHSSLSFSRRGFPQQQQRASRSGDSSLPSSSLSHSPQISPPKGRTGWSHQGHLLGKIRSSASFPVLWSLAACPFILIEVLSFEEIAFFLLHFQDPVLQSGIPGVLTDVLLHLRNGFPFSQNHHTLSCSCNRCIQKIPVKQAGRP